MKTFNDLINDALPHITEIMPWDLEEKIAGDRKPLIVDIREADEFEAMHIPESLFVPRGILETACDWDYDETIPDLVRARDKEIILVCRSGNRSVMAALTMKIMGYSNVASLKTGVRGWNDYDQPLVDRNGNEVDPDDAEAFLENHVRHDQKSPV